jgi:hypothetical protein
MVYTMLSIFMVALGVWAIRDGESPFAKVTESLFGFEEIGIKLDRHAWQAWINARLPNPQEQIALRDALNLAYPRSRFSTAVGIVLVGGGGWMILNVLSAITQFFVERFLSNIFK